MTMEFQMAPVPNEPTIPSAAEARLAREVSRALEQHHAEEHTFSLLIMAAEHEVTKLELPPGAANLLMEILKQMAAGNAVSLLPVKPEITTQ